MGSRSSIVNEGSDSTTAISTGNSSDAARDGEVESETASSTLVYQLYRRRWLGVAQLTLLNIVISMGWLTFSPITSLSASFFATDTTTINWFSTALLFAFIPASPLAAYLLHQGPKLAMMVASGLVLVGSWLRYAGAATVPEGVEGQPVADTRTAVALVMTGQILLGFAQPLVLAAPTRYASLWFAPDGRVAVTALMTLANPLGAAVVQVLVSTWVETERQVPDAVLYLAIISSIVALPSPFLPAFPPTPSCPTSTSSKSTHLAASLGPLARQLEFWLLALPFAIYVGLFNSVSTLLEQIMTPYGFTPTDAGIAGAVLIGAGLAAAGLSAPVLARSRGALFLPTVRVMVPLLAVGYVVLVFVPAVSAPNTAGPTVVCAVIGMASFVLVPVALELLAEVTYPVGPEVSSAAAWAGGQLIGGVLVLAGDALRGQIEKEGSMQAAVVLFAALAVGVMPLPLCLGRFGRQEMVRLKRSEGSISEQIALIREPNSS